MSRARASQILDEYYEAVDEHLTVLREYFPVKWRREGEPIDRPSPKVITLDAQRKIDALKRRAEELWAEFQREPKGTP